MREVAKFALNLEITIETTSVKCDFVLFSDTFRFIFAICCFRHESHYGWKYTIC